MNFSTFSKLFSLVLIFIMLSAKNSNGQSNLRSRIDEIKSYTTTTELAVFKKKVMPSELNLIKDHGKDLLYFEINNEAVSSIISAKPQLLRLKIPHGSNGEELSVLIYPKDPYVKNAIGRSADGKKYQFEQSAYYRGIVEGDEKSMVALCFRENEMSGVISSEKGQFDIGKTLKSNYHLIYKAASLPFKHNFHCGSDELEQQIMEKVEDQLKTRDAGDCVKIYFETSYSIFQNKGSVQKVLQYVNDFFNVVAALYENDGISLEISEIYVWNVADPFPIVNSFSALNFFREYRTNFVGDLAHLLAYTPNNNGGVAYLNVLCNNNFRYAYSDIYMNYDELPNYSWTIEVVAHELGHNIGSEHTQWCGWPVGALDDCYTTEGGCAPGPPPVNGGTVMSYCHLTGNGINFANGFGPYPSEKLRNKIIDSGCLSDCVPPCPQFVLSGTINNALCAGGNTGSIILNEPTVGQPPFQYQWSNGASSQSISGLLAGTYQVTVVDAMSCSGVETFVVGSPAPININGTVLPAKCNGQQNGSITLSVSGGVANYSYIWNTGAITSQITGLPAGNYSVTVTDGNNCSAIRTFEVSQPDAVDISAFVENVSCNGANDGSITISGNGGTPPYTYLWDNGSTLDFQVNLSVGIYNVTVTDQFSCSNERQYVISEPQALIVNVITEDASAPDAFDGFAIASVSGGVPFYLYSWSNGAISDAIYNLAPGLYSVTITDQSNCSKVEQFSIGSDACQLSFEVEKVDLICPLENEGSATAVVGSSSGNVTYLWSTGEVGSSIEGLAAGSYTVTVTDETCASIQSFLITSPDQLSVNADVNASSCNSFTGSIDLEVDGGNGGYSFQWSNGKVTEDITGLASGLYSVTVTDSKLCTSSFSFTVISNDNDAPYLLADTLDIYLDGSGNITLDTSLGIYFFADDCSGFTVLFGDSEFDCNNLGFNQVSVSATDDNGNINNSLIYINVIDTLNPYITCPSDITKGLCQGAPVWDDIVISDNCFVTVTQTSGLPIGSLFPLGSTINEFIATDISGNSDTCSFTVNITEGLVIDLNLKNMSCHNVPNGSAEVNVSNLTPPFTIKWSNGMTTPKIINLTEGSYSVTISDGNNCTSFQEFNISNPAPIKMDLISVTDASSSNSNDGVILVEVTGGTGTYDFEWSTGGVVVSESENPDDLAPGSYKVVIRDSNGCVLVGAEISVGIKLFTNNWKKDPIAVYPNPAGNMIFVSTKEISNCKITIFDIFGRSVEVNSAIDKDKSMINTSLLLNGAYILRIDYNDQWYVTKFVVKH